MAPPLLPIRRDPFSVAGGVPRSFSRAFLRGGDAAPPGAFGDGALGKTGGSRGAARSREKSAALRQGRGHRWLPRPAETICLLQMVWKVIKAGARMKIIDNV